MLVLFLLLFVIGVPLLLLYSMQSSVDANGLPRACNEVLAEGLKEALDVRNLQAWPIKKALKQWPGAGFGGAQRLGAPERACGSLRSAFGAQ